MEKNQHNLQKIFQDSDSLSEQEIQNYLQNNVSAKERFRVENTLLDSPLDAEAVKDFRKTATILVKKKRMEIFNLSLKM